MEDKFHNIESYDYCDDNESDDEQLVESSDDEKRFEYFLTTETGKDVLKEKVQCKDKGDTSTISSSYTEKITLGSTVTKDNLLYDADIDKQNQDWVDKKRNKYLGEVSKKTKSDAILSCPGCMVTVCVDCQRHDVYKTQFRAMFVMNCYVVTTELLKYETKNKSKKRRKKEGPGKLVPVVENESENKTEPCGDNKELEVYSPVRCDSCQTELAVFDKDEIYHFHNVLESLS